MTNKTVTGAALEVAQTKLAEAQKTAAERRALHEAALNAANSHRAEAIEHAAKATTARAEFSNAVRNNADQAKRAELRDRIADADALATHHEAEAGRIAETLHELKLLAESGGRAVLMAKQEHDEAEFRDALAAYRDEMLPALAPSVRRLRDAARRLNRFVDNSSWTALPAIDGANAKLNGELVRLPA